MNLIQVRAEANRLLELWSQTEPRLAEWRFEFNNRKRALGCCRFREKTVEVSVSHAQLDSDFQVIDTLKHEIAHALCFLQFGRSVAVHGEEWREWARKVGAVPVSCAAPDAEGIVAKPGKWCATCPGCSHEFNWHRKPNLNATRWCMKCGSEKGKLAIAARGATEPATTEKKKSRFF